MRVRPRAPADKPVSPDHASIPQHERESEADERKAGRHAATLAERRAGPAFYALEGGGWRDYVTLLHLPYTSWHLSYVVLGAAFSPTLRYERLGATVLAFFLALGISGHALDELAGRPLRTRIPAPVLAAMAAGGLFGAVTLGLAGVVAVSPWLLAFIAFGVFIAPAYNLEWFGGRFHSDAWFAAAWGAFPLLTAYFASSGELGPAAVAGAAFAFALSLAQRSLSRRVRAIRREVRGIDGQVLRHDATVEDIDRAWALGPDERALKLLSLAMPVLAVAALLARA
ncbi:MAG TPA: hypothetical protein VFO71_03340 [Gemmatimonadales bacterium]|nr:hypothetical protein [Gemmatimonadales bacterium]